MVDEAPGSDSKLVAKAAEKAADQVLRRGAWWAAAATTGVLGAVISLAAWAVHRSIITQRDADIAALTAQTNAVADKLGQRIDALATAVAAYQQDAREQRGYEARIVTLEAEHRNTNLLLRRLEPDLQKIREDVAAIRAVVNRRDRDRREELPAPPEDLGRIPMLWHF